MHGRRSRVATSTAGFAFDFDECVYSYKCAHCGRSRASTRLSGDGFGLHAELLFGVFFLHLESWLGPREPDVWIPEQIVFPILVALNVIALLGLIATLRLRAGTRA
jgi:hypothetical protein